MPVVTYAYDSGTNAKGHLTQMTDQAGTASYTYDILGRMTTETRTLIGANNGAISKTVSYEYNLDGSLKVLHYPSGAAVTYTPDSAGQILSAVDSGSGINYVTGATYGPRRARSPASLAAAVVRLPLPTPSPTTSACSRSPCRLRQRARLCSPSAMISISATVITEMSSASPITKIRTATRPSRMTR